VRDYPAPQREVSTVAASGDLARQSRRNAIRPRARPLPAQHAHRRSRPHADLTTDPRWDNYRINALAQGVRSSISLPLIVDDTPVGALNVYTDSPRDFSAEDIRTAQAFAAQASAALALVMRYSEQLVLEEQLRNALSSRAVIDQALGIVMGQQRCDAAEAFNVLRRASQERHIKLADIAAQMITAVTGKPPVPLRPFTSRG
jgi:GAF domain-containing protein